VWEEKLNVKNSRWRQQALVGGAVSGSADQHLLDQSQSPASNHKPYVSLTSDHHMSINNMAENQPPSASTAAAAAADQPGRPYYESLRTTLRGTLEKKRKLDEQLAALEEQIYKTEGAYLEDTANSGNIVRGFDGWVKGVVVGGRGADDRRRGRVRDEDRVFSHSSVGWMRVSILHERVLSLRC
jgi:hypothetical protein